MNMNIREKISILENKVIPVSSRWDSTNVDYRYENNDAFNTGVSVPYFENESSKDKKEFAGLSTLADVILDLCDKVQFNSDKLREECQKIDKQLQQYRIGKDDKNWVRSHFDAVFDRDSRQIYKADKESEAYNLLKQKVQLLNNVFSELSNYVGPNKPVCNYNGALTSSYYDKSFTYYTIVEDSFDACKKALSHCCEIVEIPFGIQATMESIGPTK